MKRPFRGESYVVFSGFFFLSEAAPRACWAALLLAAGPGHSLHRAARCWGGTHVGRRPSAQVLAGNALTAPKRTSINSRSCLRTDLDRLMAPVRTDLLGFAVGRDRCHFGQFDYESR